jgi:hypothetical protein
VFYVVKRSGIVHPLGTAVAIDCASKTILLTAGHCCFANTECTRRIVSNLFCATAMEKNTDGSFKLVGPSFPVSVIYSSKTPDIGILRRTDGALFQNPIPVCPQLQVPWVVDAENWECRVKCYHCPVDAFRTTDMPLLGCNVTNYNAIAFHTNHHFAVTEEFLGVSSGGAMVMERNHYLLGILITTLVTPMSIDDVEVVEDAGNVSVEWSVINPSITYTTAVVPSMIPFKISEQVSLDLSAYLAHRGF